MRTRLDRVPALLLALLLPACGSDPDSSTAADSSSGALTTTGATGSTGDTGTGGATQTPTSTTGAGSTETGEPTGAATGSTGEPATTADTTGETTTGETTGDTTTGGTGSTGDTGDTSTGESGGLGPDAEQARMDLEGAVDGVLFGSESDYPWTVFALPGVAPVDEANVKELIAEVYVPHGDPTLADRAIEPRTFVQFMDPLTVMQDWWGPDEVMRAEQYQPIRDIFEDQLINPQVFRFGEKFGNVLMGQVDVFVVGETADGDVVGMFTISVET